VTISEAELQTAVIDLAHRLGWRVAHFRPAQNSRGAWRTAVSADGAGFPDLVLARKGRVIFAELKAKNGRIGHEQEAWLAVLPDSLVWRPDDWFTGRIEDTLR
jgi:hypothetical protein